MKLFAHGHATHPDWRMALALVAAQIDAQLMDTSGIYAQKPTLGWAYFSDRYADQAEALLADLQKRWPGVAWVGSVGIGVAADGVEYFDEPALAVMLGEVPADQFRVFTGINPLIRSPGGFEANTALVHADARANSLTELIVQMSERTETGYLFGGIASSRSRQVQLADGVFEGGLSGVAFGSQVALVSRVTQGCQPIGPVRRVTHCERNLITQLDDENALECLFRDLGVDGREPREALPRIQQTLAGISDGSDDTLSHPGQFGSDTRVRHLVGIDSTNGGVAVADEPEVGMQLAFCRRDMEAARRDLIRICSEIREEVEPETLSIETALALQGAEAGQLPHPARQIAGAIYVSCLGRGGQHFGAPSAELAIIRRALGDVPLVGFFASGEIARRHLYGYTGVLTVFPS